MWKNIGQEKCLTFVNCQLQPQATTKPTEAAVRPAVTISRMTCSGGRTVASKLADILQAQAPGRCPWTVFDGDLMEKVMEDHHLSKRIAAFAPEDHQSMLGDALEEMLGLHPSSWTLARDTAETVLRLAHMGNVILVGRGGNIITGKLNNVFHVRLVGSLEKRIERAQRLYSLGRRKALDLIKKEDNGRRRYIKRHFHRDIDDPTLYHLVINTDRIGYEGAARLIAREIIRQFHLNYFPEPLESQSSEHESSALAAGT